MMFRSDVPGTVLEVGFLRSNMLESALSRRPLPTGLSEALFESSHDCVKIFDLNLHLISMNRNGLCAMEIDDIDIPLCQDSCRVI
jgi:hypothetical protein